MSGHSPLLWETLCTRYTPTILDYDPKSALQYKARKLICYLQSRREETFGALNWVLLELSTETREDTVTNLQLYCDCSMYKK